MLSFTILSVELLLLLLTLTLTLLLFEWWLTGSSGISILKLWLNIESFDFEELIWFSNAWFKFIAPLEENTWEGIL